VESLLEKGERLGRQVENSFDEKEEKRTLLRESDEPIEKVENC
jgi:hypothetical protein